MTIWLGTAHHRGKPAVRGRELGRHVVVVVQVRSVVVTHAANTVGVIERRIVIPGIVRAGVNVSI